VRANDRGCNVIAPFVAARGNCNESLLLRPALAELTDIARAVGIDLRGRIVSLDGVYVCATSSKPAPTSNRGMTLNINENVRGRKATKRGRKRLFDAAIFKELGGDNDQSGDLSYVRRDQTETSVLFELIAERYERKSIAVTANTLFSERSEVFVDAAMTVAAVDRLVHHSTILEMNVESYRRRTAQAKQAPSKRARAATTTMRGGLSRVTR